MKFHYNNLIFASFFAVVAMTPARASIIDFQVAESCYQEICTNVPDYKFVFDTAGWAITNDGNNYFNPHSSGGYLAAVGGGYRYDFVTMSRVDGQSFNLVSLEAAIGRSTIELPYYINSATLNLTGYIAGGGTVTQTLELHKNWNWYSLKGFQNLTQLVFEGNTLPGFGIDNLSDVPEPGTQYLILLAAVAIAVARRRRSS